MASATAPQPALPDDAAWLDVAYIAALTGMRREMAWWRQKTTSAEARGERVDLTMLEARLADLESVLLEHDRLRQDAATLRSRSEVMARRRALLEPEPPPRPRPPARRRHDELIRHLAPVRD